MYSAFQLKIPMLFLIILVFIGKASAQDHALPDNELKRMKLYFESKLSSRYMETSCNPTSYPGWDGLPLIECNYSVTGRKEVVAKTAKVIMLNPSPEQLAHWVVYTCLEVVGNAKAKCTSRLSQQIIGQSGAQFPVAGIVFEDILPEDGIFEVYAFRNGVTVKVNGVKHLGTNQPSGEEIRKAIDGDIVWTGKYARIQSTTREQYKANGGRKDVGNSPNTRGRWLEVSRELYKSAWGKDRNELMIAWARANANQLR